MQASTKQQQLQSFTSRSIDVEGRKKAYSFADLSAYTFKRRLLIRAAALIFYMLINIIGRTIRFEVEGWEYFEEARRDGHVPIHTLWHHAMFLAVYFWRRRGIVYMTSQSFDGEYIARSIQRFGFGAVRGSSSRGGDSALIDMMRLHRDGIPVGFTVDGPRGPRLVAKMGPVMLAKMTGQPILPFTITAEHYWRVHTWDYLQVPMPFTRAHVRIAPPIYVLRDADQQMLQVKRDELQRALDEIN